MIDITDYFQNKRRYEVCPDCGATELRLYDDFCWVCPQCGFEGKDNPGDYLTPMELIDWKAGAWTPFSGKKTSLLISWQLIENGEEIDSDFLDFDTEDGTLKGWLVMYLIHRANYHGRELRFRLEDKSLLGGVE